MFKFLTLSLLLPVLSFGNPVLETYESAPRKEGQGLRLVLKLVNAGETDLYLFSEGITDVPVCLRFTQNGEEIDRPSHDCGTGAGEQRFEPKGYVLVDVSIYDALAEVPVGIRVKLYSDEACTQVVETNELQFSPDEFKEKKEPNQALVPRRSAPGSP